MGFYFILFAIYTNQQSITFALFALPRLLAQILSELTKEKNHYFSPTFWINKYTLKKKIQLLDQT